MVMVWLSSVNCDVTDEARASLTELIKILQVRLQRYVNHEIPDVQAGFRKGRGARDQIAICWIIEKARESQKKHVFLLY